MKVLLVYAHSEKKSFNGALKETAVSTLTQDGHEVKISDLYAMNFKPAVNVQDFLVFTWFATMGCSPHRLPGGIGLSRNQGQPRQ